MRNTIGSPVILVAGIAIVASVGQTASIPEETLVANIAGFDLTMRTLPAQKNSMAAFDVMENAQKIIHSKMILDRLGKKSAPRDVEKWRDEKIAQHHQRARELRDLLAHPEKARSIYDHSASQSIPFDRWLSWARNYTNEARIAQFESRVNVGHYLIDEKTGRPPVWRLLEAMAEESGQQTHEFKAPLSDILSDKDLELAQELSFLYVGDDPMFSVSTGAVTDPAAIAWRNALISTTILGPLAKEYEAILEKEYIAKVSIKVMNPSAEKLSEYLLKSARSNHSRAELLAPMTSAEAVQALPAYDGRSMLAVIQLAKDGKAAVPDLLQCLRSKDHMGPSLCLLLLRRLKAKEAVPLVEELKLVESYDEQTSNAAFSYLAALAPRDLAPIVDRMMANAESARTYTGISDSFVDPAVPRSCHFLARYAPQDARRILQPYLAAAKPGVRLAAAQAYAELGDVAAASVALDYLEKAPTEYDRKPAAAVLERLAKGSYAPRLDEISRRRNAPELAVLARSLEYTNLDPARRWKYIEAHVLDDNKMVSYWAFQIVEESWQKDDPGVIAPLQLVANTPGAVNQQRAKQILYFRSTDERWKNFRTK